MRAAFQQYSSYGSRTSLRSRAISAVLALGMGIGLILVLWTLGAFPDRRRDSNILATFDVRPPAPIEASSARAAAEPVARRTDPPTPTIAPPLPPTPFPSDMIVMSSAQFAAADIGRIARRPIEREVASVETASSGSAEIGKGPDGQPMYSARWYREPTWAELVTYMPKRRLEPGAQGSIICKMVERYRVEDCREEGESPGSGLAGAMRQASWQFLIRPPRVGGKTVTGTWVRVVWKPKEASE